MSVVKAVLKILVLALIVFGLYQFFVFPAIYKMGQIIHVIDADSYLIKIDGKVKNVQLIGVDAPERTGEQKRSQCYNYEAKQYVLDIVDQNPIVQIDTDSNVDAHDLHGRDLVYITLPNGKMLNQLLVENGMAKESNPEKKNYRMEKQFLIAQAQAKEAQKGIWSNETCKGKF